MRKNKPLLLALAAAGALLLVAASDLSSEKLTLTTAYPSPSGVYAGITATGNSFLARDGGSVVIGGMTPSASKLTVTGGASFSGVVAAADVHANGRPVITSAICAPDTGLTCSVVGSELRIQKAACVPTTCGAAAPACGRSTSGTDDCGKPCGFVAPPCGTDSDGSTRAAFCDDPTMFYSNGKYFTRHCR